MRSLSLAISGGIFARQIHLFDRSWYGRVLVERVEGFCAHLATDLRAYGEINDFEEQLSEAGVVLVKFWLSIDQQTQLGLQRPASRSPSNAKRSPKMIGATAKWPLYRDAVGDMVDRTSTEIAPWTLVESQ